MIYALFEGFLLGLLLTVLIGTSFFALINVSIRKGFRAGFVMNLGMTVSDILCILLAYFLTAEIIERFIESALFKIIAGCMFIGFGVAEIINAFRKEPDTEKDINDIKLFLHGFIINTFNPSVILFWVGALVLAYSKFNMNKIDLGLYFGSCLVSFFITSILKIHYAVRINKVLKPEIILKLNIAIGLFLILIGVLALIEKNLPA